MQFDQPFNKHLPLRASPTSVGDGRSELTSRRHAIAVRAQLSPQNRLPNTSFPSISSRHDTPNALDSSTPSKRSAAEFHAMIDALSSTANEGSLVLATTSIASLGPATRTASGRTYRLRTSSDQSLPATRAAGITEPPSHFVSAYVGRWCSRARMSTDEPGKVPQVGGIGPGGDFTNGVFRISARSAVP